jgi:hypothetical protein
LTATPSHPPSGPEIPQTGAVQIKVLGCRPARGWTVDSGQKSGTLDRARVRILLHSGRGHPGEECGSLRPTPRSTSAIIGVAGRRIPQRSRLHVPTSAPAASDIRPATDPVAPLPWLRGVGGSATGADADMSLRPGHKDTSRRRESNGTEKRRQICRPLKATLDALFGPPWEIARRWSILGDRRRAATPTTVRGTNVMAHLANWEGRNRPKYLNATHEVVCHFAK